MFHPVATLPETPTTNTGAMDAKAFVFGQTSRTPPTYPRMTDPPEATATSIRACISEHGQRHADQEVLFARLVWFKLLRLQTTTRDFSTYVNSTSFP